ADIKSNLDGDALIGQAQAVLDSLQPYEHEVTAQDGACYLLRIQPYRTLDNVIDGVVLTFTDISQRVAAETAAQKARHLAESIVATVREPLVVLDGDMKVISASRSFYRYFRTAPEETVGRSIYDLGNGQWNIPALRELLETILPRDQSFEDFVIERDFPLIGHSKMLLNARRLVGDDGEKPLLLLAMEAVAPA
ncbi:MAG TPA: PAS domain-containing protein, partial [Rhodocyclaceae bacterium]|nr:PAS domain-containing protein [Rhodocyclaceae bacterium]